MKITSRYISLRSLGLGGLFLLSLIQPLGFLLEKHELQGIGILSSASPFAEVFTGKPLGYEYWASSISIAVETVDGKNLRWVGYRGGMGDLGVHHLTQVFHALPIVFAPFQPYEITGGQVRPFFCLPKSALLNSLGWEEVKVRTYQFVVTSRDKKFSRQFQGSCL